MDCGSLLPLSPARGGATWHGRPHILCSGLSRHPKAPASRRTPYAVARFGSPRSRANVWTAGACSRFRLPAAERPGTGDRIFCVRVSRVILKRRQAGALHTLSRGSGAREVAPTYGLRELAPAFACPRPNDLARATAYSVFGSLASS